jgi:hypothetical protein
MRGQIKDGVGVDKVDFVDLLKTAAKTYKPKNEMELNAIRNLRDYDRYQSEIKRVSDTLNQGIQAGIKAMGTDPNLKGLFKDDRSGMIDEQDIVPLFKQVNPITGVEVVPDYIKKQMAQAYFDGVLKVSVAKPEGAASAARSGGSTFGYTDINFNGKNYHFYGNIFDKRPTPDEYKRQLRRFNERVPIPIGDVEYAEGVYASPIFAIRNEPAAKLREVLGNSTQTNSNIKAADGSDIDPDDQEAIRNAVATNKDVRVEVLKNSKLNNGKEAVKITFPPGSEKDPFAGNSYFFPINIVSSSPDLLKTFAEVDDVSEFAQYSKKNKPFVIDYHESSGVKAEIRAIQPGSNEVTVTIFTKFDPVTKTYTDNWIKQDPIPFSLNNIGFQELNDNVYNNVILPYVQTRIAYDQQLQKQQTTSNGVVNSLKLNW